METDVLTTTKSYVYTFIAHFSVDSHLGDVGWSPCYAGWRTGCQPQDPTDTSAPGQVLLEWGTGRPLSIIHPGICTFTTVFKPAQVSSNTFSLDSHLPFRRLCLSTAKHYLSGRSCISNPSNAWQWLISGFGGICMLIEEIVSILHLQLLVFTASI